MLKRAVKNDFSFLHSSFSYIPNLPSINTGSLVKSTFNFLKVFSTTTAWYVCSGAAFIFISLFTTRKAKIAARMEVTTMLIKNGINVTIGTDLENAAKSDLIVYTAAISEDNPELILAKEKNIPIRIGVNSGSINKEIEKKYGNGALGLVESAKEHIKILEELDFYNIVVSIKASSVLKTIEAYELFSKEYNYPVHLGVTEAGTNYSGSIKSAVALGHLLLNGIGDTIRVSLTDNPVNEVIAAKEILSSIELYQKPVLVSCPTCGRCQYDMVPIANEINKFLNNLPVNSKIKVAVMGCIVNGPGEAKDADLGIAGGKNCAMFFKNGETVCRFNEENIINYLKNEIIIHLNNLEIKYFDSLNDDIKNLRTEIFINEQGFINEFDDKDLISKFVVVYQNNKAIGTGRVYLEDNQYHIGRICVSKKHRINRIGSIILMALEKTLEKGKEIILSSQDQAKDFYLKNNYKLTNNQYYDEHCLHVEMKKMTQ